MRWMIISKDVGVVCVISYREREIDLKNTRIEDTFFNDDEW